MDEAPQTSTDRAMPDFSGLAALELPTTHLSRRQDRRLRGLQSYLWWPLLLCAGLCQFAGLIFGPVAAQVSDDWAWIIGFFMCVYSVVPAQICLLNIGLIFERGPLSQRVFVYWMAMLVLLASWYLWLWLANYIRGNGSPPGGTMEEFAEAGIILPIYVATLQLPLWLVRCWFWTGVCNEHLAEPEQVSKQPATLQFSLRDLLIAIVLFALTFGAYRQLWSWVSAESVSFGNYTPWVDLWWRTAGIALAIVPPSIAWLSLRRFNYFAGWVATFLYTIMVVLIGTAIFMWLEQTYYLGAGAQGIIFAMTGGFALPVVCGLNLLRAYGWRIERNA